MRALKTIIVIMAIFIVAGLGLLAYGLVTKVGGSSEKDQATQNAGKEPVAKTQTATTMTAPILHTPFGAIETVLPANGRVVEMAVDQGRIVVRVETSDGGQSLMVFDLNNGAPLGVIRIGPPK